MKSARFVCLFVLFAITTVLAQNPVPLVNQPLVPSATAPGGAGFTLTVNGTGFVTGSSINWNGKPLVTTFVNRSQLTAIVPTANIATASTASIAVSSPSPGGGISNVAFLPVSAPTTLQFTTFADSAATAQQAIVADFTGNGNLDFAVNPCFGQNDCPINVYLGNGAGTFQFIHQDFQTVNAFADGDFNADGKLDLVGTNCTDGLQVCTLYTLLGNGDGTFSTVGNGITVPWVSVLVAPGDYNGDGKLDVAIAPSTGGIYVFLGNGDGTFQNALISNVGTLNTFGGVGDFNGDGKLDLIGVLASNQLGFIQGNGDGTFQTPTTYYSVGANTGRILAADLNGDAKLDLITVQGSPTNTFTVLLGNGDGTFQAQTPSPVGSSLSGGAVGDLNADGKLDLVLSDYANTQTLILPGNGDGTFQSPIVTPLPASTDVAIGDFNKDGKLDLVLAPTGYVLQEVPVASLDPSTTVPLGSQMVGTTSPPYPIMLSNAGSAPLIVTSMSITGANPSDFAYNSMCGSTPTLQTYDHCQINVTFTPTAAGSRSASFTVASNGIGSPTAVGLTGTGVAPPPLPYLSPASVTFPSQYVGTSGLPQSVTLNNPGAELVIISVTATPADFAPLSTCGNMIAPGGSCSIGVFFDPTTSGTRTGTLTVTDNASNSPQTASLTGTGQDFSLSPGSQTSATVSPGQAASYKVAVAPDGGFNQTVTLSCSGAPAQSTCSVSPSSIKLSGSASTATVTVTTAGSSAGLTQPINGPSGNMFGSWLALSGTLGLAMLVSLAGCGRERRPRLLYGLAFLCLLSVGVTMSACGGGGSGSGSGGGGGTQAGTYNLTVSGTFTSGSTNLIHKTNLTLVVQ